jgi:hypothetical protein
MSLVTESEPSKSYQYAKDMYIVMFAKARCRLCSDQVRFALRHLRVKHPEVLADKDVARLNMPQIMKRFFV